MSTRTRPSESSTSGQATRSTPASDGLGCESSASPVVSSRSVRPLYKGAAALVVSRAFLRTLSCSAGPSSSISGGILAQRCDICGKGTMSGNNVSHAHNLTRRTWNPNLQRVRALVEGRVKNIDVCTRCLRGNKVTKAVRGRKKPATV